MTNLDTYVYDPGEETKLVNSNKHSHTVYIGGPTTRESMERSKFGNSYEGRYDNDLLCLKIYELDLYYKLLSDEEFFQDVMDLYGEVLGCFCFPDDYCHGVTLVDFLTYGFERADVSIDEVSNTDEWVIDFIGRQLSAIDSTKLPPVGIEMRAKVEERIANITGESYGALFSTLVEEETEGWDERLH